MYRIQALFLSIVLFFVGLIYGDKPVEIDYTVEINGTEISVGDSIELPAGEAITVSCSCENVGRPFEGKTFYEPSVSFYKYADGEKVYLELWGASPDIVSRPKLIKGGESFDISAYFEINPDKETEPGVYTMEVSVYGCKQIFEDALVIK